MPYINESARLELDSCIDNMVECLKILNKNFIEE